LPGRPIRLFKTSPIEDKNEVETQFVKVSSILARILQLKLLFQENGHSSFTTKRFMDDLGSHHNPLCIILAKTSPPKGVRSVLDEDFERVNNKFNKPIHM
jgi:hypothetical protein